MNVPRSYKSKVTKKVTIKQTNKKAYKNKKNSESSVAGEAISRPCDRCRKHRIRCDRSPEQCGHCKRHDVKCTYLDIPKKRGPKSKVDKDVRKYMKILEECNQANSTSKNLATQEQACAWEKNSSSSDQAYDINKSCVVPMDHLHGLLGGEPNYNYNPTNYSTIEHKIPTIFLDNMSQQFLQNQNDYPSLSSAPSLCINDTIMNIPVDPNYYNLSPFGHFPEVSTISSDLWLNVPIISSPQPSSNRFSPKLIPS